VSGVGEKSSDQIYVLHLFEKKGMKVAGNFAEKSDLLILL